ncbi:MAG: hypothetical protein AAF721_03970 [Myxococcota bacterium]
MPTLMPSVALLCATQLAFAPPTGDTWSEADAAPAADASAPIGPAAPPSYAPNDTGAPDPALVEKNRKLTDKMHVGERWMIGGRVGLGLSGLPILIGVIALGVHGARRKAYNATMMEDPFNNRARNVGIGFLVVGVGGLVTSAVFAGLGFNKVQEARAGQLGISASRRMAGLTYSRRF